MPTFINQAAEKGVPIVVPFGVDTISPFRIYTRIAGVDFNNIRLLGILRFARRTNTSEPSQFYVIERFEVRGQRDSFVSAPQSGYLAGDAIQFVPLFDFTSVVVNT